MYHISLHLIRYILTIFLFSSTFLSVFAQKSWVEADKESYLLYTSGNWADLADYGQKAADNGFDFYYLNLRTGIAFYQLKKWAKAEKYCLKAIASYSQERVAEENFAQEYLYWTYQQMGYSVEAANVYQQLPLLTQKRFDNPPSKSLKQTHFSIQAAAYSEKTTVQYTYLSDSVVVNQVFQQ